MPLGPKDGDPALLRDTMQCNTSCRRESGYTLLELVTLLRACFCAHMVECANTSFQNMSRQ